MEPENFEITRTWENKHALAGMTLAPIWKDLSTCAQVSGVSAVCTGCHKVIHNVDT